VLTLSRELDHIGAFARTLDDVALVLDAIAGYDAADPDTRAVAAPAFRAVASEPPPLPPRFAFVRTPIWDKADTPTRAAFEEFARRLGDNAEAVDLPHRFAGAWEAHRAIMAVDMAHNLGALVDRGGEASSATLRAIIEEGRTVSAASYLAATESARLFRIGLAEIFNHFDAILTPASTGVAPRTLASTGDPAFCSLWTLTGLPALSLPILEGEAAMPLGVQVVGAAGDDARLLRTANWLIDFLAGKAPGRRRSHAKA
jgi:Asp-tRNA(Asn)/Glu-tRNA(Gln) amidotransferase A subunit family amidase